MEFNEKVAVVTGGAKGIGAATARGFLRDGASVAVLDIDADAPDYVRGNPERCTYVNADVSSEAQVRDAVREAGTRFGGIDYLVNCAGIQRYAPATETSEAEWDLVMNVNLKSAFLCAKHSIPHMQARGGGVVVNLASVQSFVSQQNVAAYTTSKSALLGLTRSIAVDYAPVIRCVAVCPGTVDTPMLRNAIALSPDPEAVFRECVDMHPLKRVGLPEEIGELILFLCSDRAGFITGQYIRIDGGLGLSIGGSKRE
jgi:NAD(P)-dependent dehydrogenase (short-subunit alcohol dehydrogenase family)